MKVTIYTNHPMVGLTKMEGKLTGVSNTGVTFIPKRGRRERELWTYYQPFIMVVEGWNKPDPDSPWESVSKGPEVEVQRGRYRGTDPRWVTDFTEGMGSSLRPIVLFKDGKLVKDRSGMARVAATIEITKADMDKLHKDGEAQVGGHTLTFKTASVSRLSHQAGRTSTESTTMDPLRRATIRLAKQQPKGSQFRKALIDILAQDFDPDSIADISQGGAHKSDTDEPYMDENFTQQESDELSDKQVDGQLGMPDDGQKKYAARKEAALRKATIRLASQQPKGSKLRRALLEALKG